MRALLAVLLLLTLAFAGCASKGKGGDDSDSDPTGGSSTKSGTSTTSGSATGTGSSSGSTTMTGTGAPNGKPTAQLGAATASGSLLVNFTVDASDPDGDALNWSLAFGDGSFENGTVVPTNTTRTFSAAGTYTDVLTVSDGLLNATSSVNVTLEAGAPAMQDFEGEWAIGNVDAPNVASADGCDAIEPMDGVFMALFGIDAATRGKPYTATVDASSTADSIIFWEVKFLDASCAILEGPNVEGPVPIAGTVPVGAVHAWMSSDGGARVTGTYHAG